jgi:hypothetical protein
MGVARAIGGWRVVFVPTVQLASLRAQLDAAECDVRIQVCTGCYSSNATRSGSSDMRYLARRRFAVLFRYCYSRRTAVQSLNLM